MTPLSSYVKTVPYHATYSSSAAFVNAFRVTTHNFNLVSFKNIFYFFSILISEFQLEFVTEESFVYFV